MTSEQKMVAQFMNTFGQEVKTRPEIPTEQVRMLRARLIFEEALELINKGLGLDIEIVSLNSMKITENNVAFYPSGATPDLVEIADGMGDSHYVNYCGTAVACGIDMEPVFAEIHRSNMSKLWTEEELKSPGIPEGGAVKEKLRMDHGMRRFLVKNQFGKAVKSPSYSLANIKGEIEYQIKSK